ncbi:MAG: response regulator [Proteobacteria bacterium]|nr:response regulator [Pseudomonadota bacterium]
MTWTLLIVDDEPEIRAELAEYFEGKGYRVEQAADGLEALEKFEASAPDAVITDLKMPRCDGFELIQRLRAADASLPIVAVAGTYSHDELDRAGDLGAQVIMRKPIGLRELAGKLRALLEPSET